MIIDCHAHVGKDIFGERNNILNFNGTSQEQKIEELVSKMDNLRVDKCIVYPFPSPLAQFGEDDFWYHKENSDLINCIREYENRLYFIPAFNPSDKKSVNYALELIEKYELKGLKIHTRPTQYDPSLLDTKIIEFPKERDLLLILHIGSGKELELKEKGVDISLTSAMTLAKKYPDVRFVFAHLGRLHESLEEVIDLENVMVDTSGLSVKKIWKDYSAECAHNKLINLSPEEIISYLVDKGYEDKIMWGSDEPYGASYEEELIYVKNNENLTPRQKEKLLSKNAIQWFKL